LGAIVTISDLTPLHQIFQLLESGYEGICKNQMQKIQDFQREVMILHVLFMRGWKKLPRKVVMLL
jgi:hypothetical protein